MNNLEVLKKLVGIPAGAMFVEILSAPMIRADHDSAKASRQRTKPSYVAACRLSDESVSALLHAAGDVTPTLGAIFAVARAMLRLNFLRHRYAFSKWHLRRASNSTPSLK